MRRSIAMILMVAVATLAYSNASAQRKPKKPTGDAATPAPAEPGSNLNAQDKRMLKLATECARRLGKVMEKWIADKRTTRAKVFSFLYYPIPKTDPPKFNSDTDHLTDKDFFPIQEHYIAQSKAIRFVVAVDKNGYLPTHNKKYSKPLTGHLSVDLVSNRTKRIFNDITGIRAARNTKPYLLQSYKRDTGEVMNDLSVPIYVLGSKWGSIRFGYVTQAE